MDHMSWRRLCCLACSLEGTAPIARLHRSSRMKEVLSGLVSNANSLFVNFGGDQQRVPEIMRSRGIL